MGDPAAAAGAAASSAADAGGGGGGGFDPSAGMGGGDPSFGMGPFDPSTGLGAGDIGAGSAFGSFGGQIPGDPTGSLSAQQSINPQGLNQPPITDQPSPASQGPGQTQQPQASQLEQVLQRFQTPSEALWHGPTSLSGTPGGQQLVSGSPPRDPLPLPDFSSHESNIDPQQREEYRGPVSQFSWGVTDASQNVPWEPLPNTNLGQRFPSSGGLPKLPPPPPPPPVTNYGGDNLPLNPADKTGNIHIPQEHPTTGQDLPAATPPAASQAPGNITGLPYPSSDTPASPSATPPGATPASPSATSPGTIPASPSATSPGTTLGMGGMGGSPLEQLIGGFLHMLLGGQGGIGSMLEQMIDRALGINPQRMLTSPGAAFNPPPPSPGSGYLPSGATGGRPVVPGNRPAQGAGTGTPPLPRPTPPGPPGSPGNPPSALPPSQRQGTYSTAYGGQEGLDRARANEGPVNGRPTATGLPQGAIHVPQGVRPPPGRPTMPSVDRSSLAKEASNPAVIRRLAWMVNGEIGKDAPDYAKQVQLETVFNRALADRSSLAHALSVHMGRGSGGYYPPTTYSRKAMPSDAEMAHFQSNILRPVLNGSNLSDQGYGPMTGNASNAPHNPVAAHQFARGQQGYILGKESYFQERANTINRLRPVETGLAP